MGDREVQTPVAPSPQDGTVILLISADHMEVRAVVRAPAHGGEPVTLERVTRELEEASVCFGIDMEAVGRMIETAAPLSEGEEGPAFVVAVGRPPVHGEAGAILHHELLQTPSGYPRLREDGTADYFELNMVRNVQAGTQLATRKPPTPGHPGSDVHGRPLPAQEGRDVKLRAGKGTKLAPDGRAVLAAMEGHAAISDSGEVTVSPIFHVEGDVDFSTGNIDFVGTVVVRGDVGPGFTVKAAGNVEVHGGITGGTVEAGGDVVVRYGITAGGRGRVKAGGKVQCRFVEGAEISAGGDVTVSEGILNSTVFSGTKVMVSGPRGSIIGGQVRARHEVQARIIGSNVGTPTEIQVGMAPDLYTERERLRRKLHQVEERLSRAAQTASFLREQEARSPAAFTEVQRQSLRQSVRSQNQWRADREVLLARLSTLQAQVDEVKSARIRATEMAYPSVRIVIGTERYLVVDLCHRSCFFLTGEGVVGIAPA